MDPLTAKSGNQFLVDPFVFFQGRQAGRIPADLLSEPLHSLQLPVKITETGSGGLPSGFQFGQIGFSGFETCLQLGKFGNGLFVGQTPLLSLFQVGAAAVEDILGAG